MIIPTPPSAPMSLTKQATAITRPVTWMESIIRIGASLYIVLSTCSGYGGTWWRDVLKPAVDPTMLVFMALATCCVSAWLITRMPSAARSRHNVGWRALWILATFLSLVGVTLSWRVLSAGFADMNPSIGIAALWWSSLAGLLVAECLVLTDALVVMTLIIKDMIDETYVVLTARWLPRTTSAAQLLAANLRNHQLETATDCQETREKIEALATTIRLHWARQRHGTLIVFSSLHRTHAREAARLLVCLQAWCEDPHSTTANDVAWCLDLIEQGLANDTLNQSNLSIIARHPSLARKASWISRLSWPLLVSVIGILTGACVALEGMLREIREWLQYLRP